MDWGDNDVFTRLRPSATGLESRAASRDGANDELFESMAEAIPGSCVVPMDSREPSGVRSTLSGCPTNVNGSTGT